MLDDLDRQRAIPTIRRLANGRWTDRMIGTLAFQVLGVNMVDLAQFSEADWSEMRTLRENPSSP